VWKKWRNRHEPALNAIRGHRFSLANRPVDDALQGNPWESRMHATRLAAAAILGLTACDRAAAPRSPAPSPPAPPPAVEPPAPGTPGGLPDERTPLAEGPIAPHSAQGAGQVVQSYFALLEAGRYAEARRLWADGGRASGRDDAAFAASFADYAEFHANLGAPGRVEGAAGSLYVSQPVQIYGKTKAGQPVALLGEVRLKRVNDVPGSTPEQRSWRIFAVDVKPGS
jgi:hypothetical protein